MPNDRVLPLAEDKEWGNGLFPDDEHAAISLQYPHAATLREKKADGVRRNHFVHELERRRVTFDSTGQC